MGDAGAERLPALIASDTMLPKLENLLYEFNRIGDRGIDALARALDKRSRSPLGLSNMWIYLTHNPGGNPARGALTDARKGGENVYEGAVKWMHRAFFKLTGYGNLLLHKELNTFPKLCLRTAGSRFTVRLEHAAALARGETAPLTLAEPPGCALIRCSREEHDWGEGVASSTVSAWHLRGIRFRSPHAGRTVSCSLASPEATGWSTTTCLILILGA